MYEKQNGSKTHTTGMLKVTIMLSSNFPLPAWEIAALRICARISPWFAKWSSGVPTQLCNG